MNLVSQPRTLQRRRDWVSSVARLDLGSEGSPGLLADVQGILLGLAETATILAAPPSWKQGHRRLGTTP